MWVIRERVQGPEDEASGGGGLGDFDVASALAEISGGLGFEGEGSDEGTDSGAGGTGADDGAGDDNLLGDGDTGRGEGKAPDAGDNAKGSEETAGAEDKAATDAATKPQITADAPPKTWKPEAAAEWDKVPPVVRAEIARREEAMFQGLEAYKLDAGFGKTVQKVLEPYVPILQQHGINPIQQIGDLMNAHKTLALGTPEAKVGMLRWLAKEYSIPLDGAAVSDTPAYVDPAVQSLQKDLQDVRTKLSAAEEFQHAQSLEKAKSEVLAFQADPKNVHFNELMPDIHRILQTKKCSLQQAYDEAIWLNPVTRDKEIARQTAEREKARKDEEAAKVAEARRATGANVRTTAKKGSAAAPVGTLDDTLNRAYDEITGRG